MKLGVESLWRSIQYMPFIALMITLFVAGWSVERVLLIFKVFFLAVISASILIMNRDMKEGFKTLEKLLKKDSDLPFEKKEEVKTTGAGASL